MVPIENDSLGQALRDIWEDQAAFNLLFRMPPGDADALAEQVRDMVLNTESELHELLRCTQWKAHRKTLLAENRSHMVEEAADIFKYALSIFQILGITPEELMSAYRRKTAVCRQRYLEEWQSDLTGDFVVVDIEHVLADYINGFGRWLLETKAMTVNEQQHLSMAINAQEFLSARSVGVNESTWQAWKHEFRVGGGKRGLPVMPGARDFLTRQKIAGRKIVLLTSRPIDKYPNIFTDTLLWLQMDDPPFDFIWWSHDKAERVLQSLDKDRVKAFVDDDFKFIQQVGRLGLPTYWLNTSSSPLTLGEEAYLMTHPMVFRVRSLDAISIGTLTEA